MPPLAVAASLIAAAGLILLALLDIAVHHVRPEEPEAVTRPLTSAAPARKSRRARQNDLQSYARAVVEARPPVELDPPSLAG